MELILIRHGLPEKVVARQDGPADPELSPQGHDQAAATAAWLRDRQIDRLYSSPMRRAIQTAEPLSQLLNLDIEIREGVAEFDRDHHTYVPVEEFTREDFERVQAMMDGSDGGGLPAFSRMVIDALTAIVAENAGKRVAVACHGGVVNMWASHVMGVEPRIFFVPDYASVSRFMIARNGAKSLLSLNEAAP